MVYKLLRTTVILFVCFVSGFATYVGWDVVRQARTLFAQQAKTPVALTTGSSEQGPLLADAWQSPSTDPPAAVVPATCELSASSDSFVVPVDFEETMAPPSLPDDAFANQGAGADGHPEALVSPMVAPSLPECTLPACQESPLALLTKSAISVAPKNSSPESGRAEIIPACQSCDATPSRSSVVIKPSCPQAGPKAKGQDRSQEPPIECEIVDRDSGSVVASFRISEATDVTTTFASDCEPATPLVQPTNGANSRNQGPYAPFLDLRIDLNTGHTIIEARNSSLQALVAAMSQRYHFPIQSDAELDDVVSARIEARDPVTALRHIMEPVGYAVLALPDQTWRVVRAPDTQTLAVHDMPMPVILATEQRQVQARRAPPVQLASHASPVRAGASRLPINPSEICDPKTADVIDRCRGLLVSGQTDTAIDGLTELLAASPNCSPATRLLAEAYVARDDLESALTAGTEAIRLNRRSADANAILAKILMAIGQDERGRHYLRQAEYLRADEQAR